MALSSLELRFQRKQTAAFISVSPTVLELIPRTLHKDGAGTRWVPGETREPQTFRLIDQSSSGNPSPGIVRAADGVQRLVAYVMLGNWDAVVAVGDYWTDSEGVKFTVDELMPVNGYEIRAVVIRYGE